MKRIFAWTLITVILFLNIPNALAGEEVAGIVITPTIISEKAKAREIFKYTFKIKNNNNFKADIYPIVNDLSTVDGRQEFTSPTKLDKARSLARWIEIARGVIELKPGEEKEVPFKVEVNLSAVPGKYYASIIFAMGRNRPIAEENSHKNNQAKILLDYEVGENAVEKIEIKKFSPNSNIFFSPPIAFSLDLFNIGNKNITPQGQIIIYNRRNQEVSSIEVNDSSEIIEVGNNKIFDLNLGDDLKMGRYKAKLELEYGSKGQRDLQDVVYFFVLPWKTLILFSIILIILLFSLVYFIFKKTFHHQKEKYDEDQYIEEYDDAEEEVDEKIEEHVIDLKK